MIDPDKKELERRIIEVTRQRCTLFPQGELSEFERPDWLIPSACLGIEVSQLLPERAQGAMFAPPQLSEFQKQVVSMAERNYRQLPGAGPVDVLVYFTNEWTRKNDANLMGRALAEFVRTNYPSDGSTVVFDEVAPDGFSVVRITPAQGAWHTGSVSNIEYLTYGRLNCSIAAKSRKVAEYRARLAAHATSTSNCASGWQMWLLLATRVPVLWSLSCPPEVASWHFASEFDRVFLASNSI
jgi:hypothetical protein